jgi:hypothetical protein
VLSCTVVWCCCAVAVVRWWRGVVPQCCTALLLLWCSVSALLWECRLAVLRCRSVAVLRYCWAPGGSKCENRVAAGIQKWARIAVLVSGSPGTVVTRMVAAMRSLFWSEFSKKAKTKWPWFRCLLAEVFGYELICREQLWTLKIRRSVSSCP